MPGEPLVEELALDISPALEAIEPLGVALDDIVVNFGTGLADALASSVGTPIDTTGLLDTSGVQTDLEGAVAGTPLPDIEVPAELTVDTSAAADAIAGLQGESVSIEVEADTAAAADSVAALGDAATAAVGTTGGGDGGHGEGLAGLEGAVIGVRAATGVAKGEVGELTGEVGGLGAGFGAAVAGGAAFTAFLGEAVRLASDAEAQNRRFTATFGPLADEIEHVNVGGLNISLEDLGKKSGTTAADLEAAASKVGLLGKSAGASGSQITETTTSVLGLAAALSVQNPRLGDAASVSDKLQRALVAGGRFAQNFGLALQAADIKARAAEIAGAGNEVTRFDLLTAGAQLAVEQFGNTLGTTFQEGSQNAQIQLRALKVEVEEALVALGKPLLGPAVETLQAFIPVAIETGKVIGEVAGIILPFVASLASVLGPAATGIGFVADGITVLEDAVSGLSGGQLAALGVGLAAIAVGSGAAAAGLEALGAAADVALGPVGLVIFALGAFGATAKAFEDDGASVEQIAEAMGKALFGTDTSVKALDESLGKLNSKLTDLSTQFIGSISKFGNLRDVFDNTLGGAAGLRDALTGTDEAFDAYVQQAKEAQNVTGPMGASIDVTTDALKQFREALIETEQHQIDQLQSTKQVSQAQVDAATATVQQKEGYSDLSAILKILAADVDAATAAQEKQAVADASRAGSLDELRRALAAGAISSEEAALKLQDLKVSADDSKTFIEGVTTAVKGFIDTAVGQLPTAGDAVDEFSKGVSDAFDQVQKDIHDKTGNVKNDLSSLKAALDPKSFIEKLFADAATINQFTANLKTLGEEGFTGLVETLASKGPEVGGNLAEALAGDKNKAKLAEAGVAAAEAASGGFQSELEAQAPNLIGQSTEFGGELNSAVVTGYAVPDIVSPTQAAIELAAQTIVNDNGIAVAAGQKASEAVAAFVGPLKLGDEAQLKILEAAGVISGDTAAPEAGKKAGKKVTDKFGEALDPTGQISKKFEDGANAILHAEITLIPASQGIGVNVGRAFADGIGQGITQDTPVISASARSAALAAEKAAKDALQIKSPSQVGVNIGEQFVAGIALGVGSVAPIVDVSGDLAVSLSASFSTAGSAALGGFIEGFNDPAAIDDATKRLQKALADGLAANAAAADQKNTAAQQLDQLVSAAVNGLPDAGAAISDFASTLTSAQNRTATATKNLHDAQVKLAADSAKGVDQAKIARDEGEVANQRKLHTAAVNNLHAAEDRLARDRATKADKGTIQADELAVIQVREVSRRTADSLAAAERKLAADKKTRTNESTLVADREAVKRDQQELNAAQKALATASDPNTFIRNLNQSTKRVRDFQADLRKLVSEGFIDLAEQLAQAGPDVAGKLADSLANNQSKAKLAEAGVDAAAAAAEGFTTFLDKAFADVTPGLSSGPAGATKLAVANPTAAAATTVLASAPIQIDLTINHADGGTTTKTISIPARRQSQLIQKVVAEVSAG